MLTNPPEPIKLDFSPHPVARGGHLQTLAGFYWPTPRVEYAAETLLVDVSDGDKIALHDDRPENWTPDSPSALLIHGLAGCHGSGYMVRVAQRLVENGVRTFRMDMRGTGASTGLARMPGHAGRSGDAAAAIQRIADRCPDSPLTMVGFSMGGNIALSTLANASTERIGNLRRGIAIAPPVDLSKCCRELRVGTGNFYDKYLVRYLAQRWVATGGQIPGKRPASIYQFDDEITAPLSGYRDAEDYYRHASSGPRLREITLPTRILAAKDDPVVAYSAVEAANRSASVQLFVTDTGGHLGYFGRRSQTVDRRWMDDRVVDWVLSAWT